MGMVSSAFVFGAVSLLLWLIIAPIIPWLRNSFGIEPLIGWYVIRLVRQWHSVCTFADAGMWHRGDIQSLDCSQLNVSAATPAAMSSDPITRRLKSPSLRNRYPK